MAARILRVQPTNFPGGHDSAEPQTGEVKEQDFIYQRDELTIVTFGSRSHYALNNEYSGLGVPLTVSNILIFSSFPVIEF